MIIDSHHHFWNYNAVEFDWIDDSMKAIRRSFLPIDLEAEINHVGVDGVISVQARQTLEETDFLIEQADANHFIKGVVGWLPLTEDAITQTLDNYSNAAKLKGARHVVQGEGPDFLDGAAFNRGIEALAPRGLVYDILILEHQLEEAIRFVDRHPSQTFVLDHMAKPQIKSGLLEPWQTNIRSLAQRENVACKLSGMVTEADFSHWTEPQLRPYLDTMLTAFGPDRVMFGSDWPVCLVACDYQRWYHLVRQYIASLSPMEQCAIMGENASRIYQL